MIEVTNPGEMDMAVKYATCKILDVMGDLVPRFGVEKAVSMLEEAVADIIEYYTVDYEKGDHCCCNEEEECCDVDGCENASTPDAPTIPVGPTKKKKKSKKGKSVKGELKTSLLSASPTTELRYFEKYMKNHLDAQFEKSMKKMQEKILKKVTTRTMEYIKGRQLVTNFRFEEYMEELLERLERNNPGWVIPKHEDILDVIE